MNLPHSTSLKPFIKRHPVATFVALTVLFSYGLGLPALWAVAAFAPRLPTIASTYVGRLLVVFGPVFAAFVVIIATRGTGGVYSWLSGLRLRSPDLAWWVVIPGATFTATVVAYRLAGTPAEQLGAAIERDWPVLVTHYVFQMALIGVGEELGWRGWMLPTLLQRHSYAGATTRVAAVWYLWHMPVLVSGGRVAVSFAVVVIALSFLFTALWAGTGKRVITVALAHGSVNAPVFFFEGTIGGQAARNAWYVACALYGLAALLIVLLRRSWWAQSDAVQGNSPGAA